ncbi:MAG: response regulator [Actinomycetota bacterium]
MDQPRILIVDDDPMIRRLLQVNFRLEGFDVAVAGRGEEALELAAGARPDIVVLDVSMPDMDGWEVMGRLRGDPPTASVPVVFLTARTGQTEQEKAQRLGADGYLVKPFDPGELVEVVKQVLSDADPADAQPDPGSS